MQACISQLLHAGLGMSRRNDMHAVNCAVLFDHPLLLHPLNFLDAVPVLFDQKYNELKVRVISRYIVHVTVQLILSFRFLYF